MEDAVNKIQEQIALLQSTDYRVQAKEFCYEKAVDALNAWKEYDISPERINDLLEMDYKSFCDSNEPDVAAVREMIFRLVAYCDTHAREKKRLNEYEDNRTIAKTTGIYQDNWVLQLLKYKLNPEQIKPGIRHLIEYLEDPENNWAIISDNDRRAIITYFCDGADYEPENFNTMLWDAVGTYWPGVNRMNATAFLKDCIYDIRSEWKKSPEIAGLFAHDTNDSWKTELLNEMSDGRYGCIWWHKLPAQKYNKEILQKLRDTINKDETFSFYYIRSKRAYFRAEVKDFATKEDYAEKQNLWKTECDPVWFSADISEYYDEEKDQSAEIVFLVESFERLPQEIPVGNFQLYKEMKDDFRSGIMAYTGIITDENSTNKNKTTNDTGMDTYIKLLESNKNIVLTGAPGTGKTYLAKQIAKALGAEEETGRCKMVQFHPSMDYTDFVEGLRPIKPQDGLGATAVTGFERRDGVFKKFCKLALEDAANKYVFIIDEINRGELSKIFGELFFSIDPGYRGKSGRVQTQYQNLINDKDSFKAGFYVPDNVYIIGTMNDIDRSVECMDFAIRRRFAWCEVTAEESADAMKLSDSTRKYMRRLNDALKGAGFSEAYYVGGAYFLGLNEAKIEDKELWDYRLRGLLAEYLRGRDDAEELLKGFENAFLGKTENDNADTTSNNTNDNGN